MRLLPFAPFVVLALVLPLVAGCASKGKESTGRVRPVAELPPDYAMAWRAWYDDTDDWPEWRAKVESDPKFADFYVDNLMRVLVRHYDYSAMTTAQEMPGLFERSRRELIHFSDASGPVLIELLMVGDGVVSYLAGYVLDDIDEGRWTLVLAQRLESERPEDRRRAAEWLAKLPYAGEEEEEVWRLMRAAVRDPDWFVRAQVALTAGERSVAIGRLDLARPVLVQALEDEDQAVLQAACEALRRSRDVRAVPALVRLYQRLETTGTDLTTARRAQAALVSITGARGLDSSKEWDTWWRENRP